MGARAQARDWAQTVQDLAEGRNARYEPVGGLNAVGAPVALLVGGTNRITGQLTDELWGAACDALEERAGGIFSKAVLPGGGMVKAHVPDVASALPPFAVEDLQGLGDQVRERATRNQVRFESIDFNRRYLVTVPSGYSGTELHQLFSPATIGWATGLGPACDFGILEGQMWILWRYRQRSAAELEEGLAAAASFFTRLRTEIRESGVVIADPGPWHAGLEPFPDLA